MQGTINIPHFNAQTKSPFNVFSGITRPWNFAVNIYNSSQVLTYLPGTFGFLFTNTGADIVRVNGKILYPGTIGTNLGDSFAVSGLENSAFKGQIQLIFQSAVNPFIEVIQAYYMDVVQR